MVVISAPPPKKVKKVHCPKCGGRLCDVVETEKIRRGKNQYGIIVKCYKCGKTVSISIN